MFLIINKNNEVIPFYYDDLAGSYFHTAEYKYKSGPQKSDFLKITPKHDK